MFRFTNTQYQYTASINTQHRQLPLDEYLLTEVPFHSQISMRGSSGPALALQSGQGIAGALHLHARGVGAQSEPLPRARSDGAIFECADTHAAAFTGRAIVRSYVMAFTEGEASPHRGSREREVDASGS
jgi:hypothetical protein